ncbi:MAG TPA: cytochrome c biogenesis protein DipZ [Candidatus Saccharimonadia bacterium]|nr:cytochrome c biogenesis protein DipZ [Candidatus Saccharimonadia bacterium]
MLILVLFAFLAGIVTILSPCILPILPIVLTSSLSGGRRRPIGIVIGFILSFTILTLTLSLIVKATGLSANALRAVAVVVIGFFGITMLIPKTQELLERLFSKFSGSMPQLQNKNGFWGGILIGLSLGVIWTPCVGPILAAVIALAATSTVTVTTALIMFAYAVGTAIPMFAILVGGRNLLTKAPFLASRGALIQKIFGVIMVLTAIAIALGLDVKFQTAILTAFPQYGNGITAIETAPAIQSQLNQLKGQPGTVSKPNALEKLLTPDYGPAPDFTGGGTWLNSPPLTIAQLKGKVVLVDFWTYTCINCIRTLPFVTAWYDKYKDQGLVVIGVHTPEFEFEHDTNNVKNAIKQFNIHYPVVQDNDYRIWNAYTNQYWPAEYFIDAKGEIRKEHFGEGDYDANEKFIQQLLSEITNNVSSQTLNMPEPKIQANTPETYLGYNRIDRFGSNEEITKDADAVYTIPTNLPTNSFAYEGKWNVGGDFAMPEQGSALNFMIDAKNVYLVMKPRVSGAVGRVKVFLDGSVVPTDAAGDDVKNGVVTVNADRLYTILKLGTPGKHTLRLEFLDSNLDAFAFTFG